MVRVRGLRRSSSRVALRSASAGALRIQRSLDCQLGHRSPRATLENDGALTPGDLGSGCEGRSRFRLVAMIERQQALATQTIDLGQIDADAGFIDARDRAIEVTKGVQRPAGGEQHFGREPEIILRQRTDRRGIGDLVVDQPHSIRNAFPGCGSRGPSDQNQAAGAPWQQAELVGQRRRAMCGRVGRLAISPN